ncbi:MAG: chromosomal replication initiator protein DnaA, partial [Rhodobacteraceae bacterium]|nr:chromosomal replication initiator protein DnaA [Paracoccaceae bacterium]
MRDLESPADTWDRLRGVMQGQIGKDSYKNWIDPLVFLGSENGVAQFAAPTSFVGTWVSRNYGEAIRQLLVKDGIPASRLSFSVQAPEAPAVAAEVPPAAAAVGEEAPQAAESDLPTSPLDTRFTFENFVVGKPNELAHAAARRVAEGGQVTFNPLFLYGGVGLGKTHLMHAIAHEVRRTRCDARVLYLSAEQFMYRFVVALRQKDMQGFKEIFRSVDMLMVDDVQFISGKESTQSEFFHTFNALIDQQKQIVISADRAPGEIEGLEERIKSRLQWGLVVDLHPTDYELRLGILQSKTEAHMLQNPGVTVGPGVLEFLAHRISSNVRVLEGALTRLFAFASLVGREINLDMAQECLADILRASERKVT